MAAAVPHFADVVLARTRTRSRLGDALLVGVAAQLIALGAQVAVRLPFSPVPLTLQTLFVLGIGAALGPVRGGLAALLYLFEGAAGLPVLAGGRGGVAHLLGPTGGYLAAFPAAAALVGALARRGWDRRPLSAALAMAFGALAILTLGTLRLSGMVGGIGPALTQGFIPFLPGEAIKVAVAAAALPSAWALVRRIHAA